MAMVYPMQTLLAGLTLLLAFPFATSKTVTTTSKEEIKCNNCTPVVYPSPPPPVINCPPPPVPLSPPPPLPPPPKPSPPPPKPSPPPPACPNCPPCPWCRLPCVVCLPLCPGCPPPPCSECQVPPGPPRPQPTDQTGMMGGAVYSPPNEVVPYFPYSFQPPPSQSAASSTCIKLKLIASIMFLLLSASFSFF